MREKLSNNTRLKLIALLSAVVLWMYVMAVVDPEETKLFENIPVNITNLDDLTDKDLIIYPETEITASIYVTGKLSTIQKMKKDDISVYGQINQPIEGKNEIYLRATPSQRVTYEFKNSVAIVNLEKIIKENRNIEVEVTGNIKDDIDTIELENLNDGVQVSGPRSLVQEVAKVEAVLDSDDQVDDFYTTLDLKAIDKKGNIVTGVGLEYTSVNAKVVLLKEKTVPIKVNFEDENEDNYKLSQETVLIKGKKQLIDKIEYITTKTINLANIPQNTIMDIDLDIPKGIICDTKYITVELNISNTLTSEFIYTSSEVEIKNNINNIDTSSIKIPETIIVNIEYDNNSEKIEKKDITLYIDLSKEDDSGKYEINYESNYDIKSITINPNTTE